MFWLTVSPTHHWSSCVHKMMRHLRYGTPLHVVLQTENVPRDASNWIVRFPLDAKPVEKNLGKEVWVGVNVVAYHPNLDNFSLPAFIPLLYSSADYSQTDILDCVFAMGGRRTCDEIEGVYKMDYSCIETWQEQINRNEIDKSINEAMILAAKEVIELPAGHSEHPDPPEEVSQSLAAKVVPDRVYHLSDQLNSEEQQNAI